MTRKTALILSQDRPGQPGHLLLERAILAGLEGRHDLRVTVVPHLYDVKSEGAAMDAFRTVEHDLILLSWLYPRSAYWVLAANGIEGQLGPTSSLPEGEVEELDPEKRTVWCLDLREQSEPEPVWAEIDRIVALVHGQQPPVEATAGNGRLHFVSESVAPRWYPVIDYGRCGSCGECLNFCLFGVFSLDEGDRLVVEQPDACRPGCPACSRICPEGAIMFPQHEDPAIAGDPKASRAALKLDLSQLFQGATPQELAEAERRRALAKPDSPASPPPDSLDKLVDRVDDLEL